MLDPSIAFNLAPDDDPDLWELATETILAEAGRICGQVQEDVFAQVPVRCASIAKSGQGAEARPRRPVADQSANLVQFQSVDPRRERPKCPDTSISRCG